MKKPSSTDLLLYLIIPFLFGQTFLWDVGRGILQFTGVLFPWFDNIQLGIQFACSFMMTVLSIVLTDDVHLFLDSVSSHPKIQLLFSSFIKFILTVYYWSLSILLFVPLVIWNETGMWNGIRDCKKDIQNRIDSFQKQSVRNQLFYITIPVGVVGFLVAILFPEISGRKPPEILFDFFDFVTSIIGFYFLWKNIESYLTAKRS